MSVSAHLIVDFSANMAVPHLDRFDGSHQGMVSRLPGAARCFATVPIESGTVMVDGAAYQSSFVGIHGIKNLSKTCTIRWRRTVEGEVDQVSGFIVVHLGLLLSVLEPLIASCAELADRKEPAQPGSGEFE